MRAAPDETEVRRRGTSSRGVRIALAFLGLVSLALLGRSSDPSPDPGAGSGEWRLRFEATGFASGDIIFRRGRSLVSRVVLSVDGGSEYSHVGLISVIDGQVWVLHAVPSEEPEQRGGVIAEPLSVFLSPDKATAAGLYRPREAGAAIAEKAAWRFVHAHIPFDSGFDLSTPNELYCTEMVWRAYREAGIDLAPPDPDRKEKYLLPSRLLRSPHLKRIQELTEEGTRP
jgi:hypothetical protein